MPYDLIALIVLVIISLIVVIYSGKSAGVSIIFSFFPAYLLAENLPLKEKIMSYGRTPIEETLIVALIFILIFLVSYVIIRKGVSVVFPWTPIQKAFEIALISVIISGLLAIFAIKIGGLSVYITSPIFLTIFNSSFSFFYWLLGSLVAMTLVLKR